MTASPDEDMTRYQPPYLTVQVTDPVARLLAVLDDTPGLRSSELMSRLQLSHRPSFRSAYLGPALAAEWIEMTDPASPRSPTQKYCLTEKGRRAARKF